MTGMFPSHMVSLREVLREFFRRQETQAGSKERLASICGVSRPAMSQMLSGRNEVSTALLVGWCEGTNTPPHRLLMSLLMIANEMETTPHATGAILPLIDYVSLPGGRKGKSAVDAKVAEQMAKPKRRSSTKRKQP